MNLWFIGIFVNVICVLLIGEDIIIDGCCMFWLGLFCIENLLFNDVKLFVKFLSFVDLLLLFKVISSLIGLVIEVKWFVNWFLIFVFNMV